MSGRLITQADGTPVAGATVPVRHHSPVALGQGEFTNAETDLDGRFTLEYPATDAGYWDFSLEYPGSGAFEEALDGSSDFADVFVVAAEPPASSDGALGSSSGTTSHVTTISGSGFDPQSPVTLVVYSQPIHLATVVTDANGEFAADVSIPTTVTGKHTIVALGRFEGSSRQLTIAVDLPALAKTGTSLTPVIGGGVALVVLGALLWWAARRRRRSPRPGAA